MSDLHDKYWYVVISKPHKDAYAEEQLKNQGYEVYRPLAKCLRTRLNKKVITIDSLFPRYMFISMKNGTDDWGPIRSTRGVQGVVRFGTRPAIVDDNLIDEIRSREEKAGQKVIDLERFKTGQIVKVDGGPFNGLNGVFESYDGEQRVIILMELLGKMTPLKLNTTYISSF